MIGYYLSSNNEIYYSTKTQTFSPTKHTVVEHNLFLGHDFGQNSITS